MKNEIGVISFTASQNTKPIQASNPNFLEGNEFFDEFITSVLKAGQYKDENPLIILSHVNVLKQAPITITQKFFDNNLTFLPSKFYIGNFFLFLF